MFCKDFENISLVFVIARTKVVGSAGGLFLFLNLSGRFLLVLLRMALRAVVVVIDGGRGLVEQFIGDLARVMLRSGGSTLVVDM